MLRFVWAQAENSQYQAYFSGEHKTRAKALLTATWSDIEASLFVDDGIGFYYNHLPSSRSGSDDDDDSNQESVHNGGSKTPPFHQDELTAGVLAPLLLLALLQWPMSRSCPMQRLGFHRLPPQFVTATPPTTFPAQQVKGGISLAVVDLNTVMRGISANIVRLAYDEKASVLRE
ncbi:hypothetical protein LY78DRAFT_672855 [Colletotrichum sublineola]|uniref:Putative YDG/SRA domain-containing protein n=1 Tax=Colletotrichum sublineola TaxID=1173701 RepID=A0A066XBS0_COLSU|nr:hypothetical protein LY78DRAFT_672855 [Colletotrichum sublineola]KDN63475.1 putative YDG/SRA domain-containing protein [Colletotrichum sublineola]